MQERQRFNTIYNDLLITMEQKTICGKDRGLLGTRILFEIPVAQISYVKRRKRFIWFGSQGFEINYRRQPKGTLFSAFFASNQIQQWIDAFNTADIKIID